MIEVDIDWSNLTDGSEDTITQAKLMYYTLNTVDVSYILFPQDKEEVYFPAGSKLIAKIFPYIGSCQFPEGITG